ncbi:photo-regulated tyrosinase [Mycena metata]|uniref:tyrosinase n=1 Tax=Mycena metata TaxID=1033252 RepID=A0AAD7J5J2_9AGAR|nr:photo-regulated tyrosinase [Mycena metata]
MPPPDFVITGASGGPSPRLEIQAFVQNEKFFSLYIQALTAMTGHDQKNVKSHFQVAGVHGRPYVQWNNSGGTDPIQPPADGWDGYCFHGSVLFPNWHRPYVAAYEQILQNWAISIASKYTTPDKAAWQEAALAFRLPYWDWMLPQTEGVPPDQVLTQGQVSIIASNGSTVLVPNPIIAYRFGAVPPLNSVFEKNFATWPTTLRCPDSALPQAHSQPAAVVQNVRVLYPQRLQAFGELMITSDWLQMSNHTRAINPSYANSLEAIHDGMHLNVGGRAPNVAGHMSETDYAGHDPIFFLHHANVDYILELWQRLFPNSWVPDSTAQDGGSWTVIDQSPIGPKSDLTPFWNSETTYWSANSARTTKAFNYSYPILAGLDESNPEKARLELKERFRKLYDLKTAFPPKPESASNPSQLEEEYLDWRVHVEAETHALGGSYSVYIFLGEVPNEPKEWMGSSSFVGVFDVFTRTNRDNCPNCRANMTAISEGVIYLGDALKKTLNSWDAKDVVPYLKENLEWRVAQSEEPNTPLSRLPSLEVLVVALPMYHKDNDPFPHRRAGREAQRFPEVTQGREGGASE